MYRTATINCFFIFLASFLPRQTGAQITSDPPLPANERIDLTNDGIADVVIKGKTEHIFDPGQGPLILQKRWVELLPGTDVLFRATRGSGGLYKLREGELLSAAALAEGFRYKQLRWSTPADSMRFDVLESDVVQGVNTGWRTGGNHYDGTFVLRSTMGRYAAIAAFTIMYTVGSGGYVGVVSSQVVPVAEGFGDPVQTPPSPPGPPEMTYSFGHEVEPQVIIPPGLPPNEEIEIIGDEAPDVVITAREEHSHGTGRLGYYVRGVSPMPGTAFLMKRATTSHPWEFFRLPFQERLAPEELSAGLANGTLRWADPEREKVFCRVVKHPFGMDHLPQEWSYAELNEDEVPVQGDLVYRAIDYTVTIIGVLEVSGYVPGGEVHVQGQNWVEEGKVLEVR